MLGLFRNLVRLVFWGLALLCMGMTSAYALVATTTTLSVSPITSASGQRVHISASVSGSNPTGTVSFYYNGSRFQVGQALETLQANGSTVAFDSTDANVRTDQIYAVYNGDSVNAPSTSATTTITVSKAPGAAVLSVTPNPVAPGQSVTLSATISGYVNADAGVVTYPTGTVQFMDGSAPLGSPVSVSSAQANAYSVAAYTTNALASGTHSLTAVYSGDAGVTAATSAAVSLTVSSLPATATTLAISPNPAVVGQTMVMTATVTGSSPGGTVTFKSGSGAAIAAPVAVSAGKAVLNFPLQGAGADSVTAVYNGDASNQGSSSSAIGVQVNQATATAALAVSPNPVASGQNVALTATLTGYSPGGTVQFMDGATALTGAVNVTPSGTTYTTNALTAGSHSLKVVYSGDANNTGVTSAVATLTVNKATATNVLSVSPNPANLGQSVTLTAIITGSVTPGGTVQFMDGATAVGAAVGVSAGKATYTTTSFALGSHSLTAVYSGDGNNTSVTSAASTLTVNKVTATNVLSVSPNPATYGQSVTLTATVTGSSPSGTVQFIMDDSLALGNPVTVSGGKATYTRSTFAVGSHTFSAVYSGDGNNTSATSAVSSLTVNKAAATNVLTVSPNPATFGQSVTLTATVTGSSPSGTVQFMDGTTALGSPVAVASGNASYTSTVFALGSHSLTAVYSGDANNTGVTSTAATLTMGKVTPTNVLTVSPNPATFGQSVTVTATVTGSSPSGTVQFMDGTTALGSPVAVASGNATYTSTVFALGSHSLTAVYSGDASNTGATSTANTLTVNKVTATNVLSVSPNPATYGQSVTLTATITGSASPGGTVQFMDGSTALGSPVTLNANKATYTSSALAVGSHSLAAVYSGDGNYAALTSSAATFTVNKATPSNVVTLSANPVTYGQSLTVTATVTGGSNPGGTIMFMDGATQLGAAVTLASGAATYTSTSWTLGTHSLAAVYSGDINNTGLTSSTVVLTVNLAAGSATSQTLQYDTIGRLHQIIYSNGKTITFDYDAAGNRLAYTVAP